MEAKLLCAAVLLVSTLSGGDAQSDVCGISSFNTRIVGGQDAAEGAWPWQVIVLSPVFCGGSLINNQWVMTAAHCFRSTNTSGVVVLLGHHTFIGPNPNQQFRRVSRIIRHPLFNRTTLDNDIALVQLSSPVTLTNYVRPVCLAAADSVYEDGTKTWVTGWGYLQNDKPPAPDTPLQEVEIPIISHSECMKNYTFVTDNMICAGVTEGGKGACYGDSGAPMVTRAGSRWVQAGLAVFMIGRSCALPNAPGGYTRVSQYEDWIKSQITTNQPGFINPSDPPNVGAWTSSVGPPASPSTSVVLTVLLSVYVLS